MNTCAECRFWQHGSVSARGICGLFTSEGWPPGSAVRRVENRPEPKAFVGGAGDSLLETEPDFGCVQFEPLNSEIIIEKPGFHKTTSRTSSPYVPWRGVTAVETPEHGDLILRLECGHVTTWSRTESTPAATKCATCDPPTFRGKPFPPTMPVLYADEGGYVEPIPGHRFGPIYFKRTQPIGSAPVPDVVSHNVAIDGQWFEIRRR